MRYLHLPHLSNLNETSMLICNSQIVVVELLQTLVDHDALSAAVFVHEQGDVTLIRLLATMTTVLLSARYSKDQVRAHISTRLVHASLALLGAAATFGVQRRMWTTGLVTAARLLDF